MTRARSFLLVAAMLAIVTPRLTLAKPKPYCRDLVFSGAAGAASHDIVTLRVVDQSGNVLDESCQLQVHGNPTPDTARVFAARITGAWGDGTGVSCTEPSPLPTKTCGNALFGGRSCKHQFKFKPDKSTVDPDDGLIRVRVCCKDTPNCKGANLTNGAISVQTKINAAPDFGPAVPPVIGIDIATVSVDPIAVIQRPPAALQTCRKDLGKLVGSTAPAFMDTLVKCHDLALTTAGTVCGLAGGDPKLLAVDAKLRTGLADTIAKSCEPSGPPGNFGYHLCPAPCGPVPIATWQDEAQCLACLVEGSIQNAVDLAYGVPGPPAGLPANIVQCQEAAGIALAQIADTGVKETVKCQQGADAGTLALPVGVKCKNADLKGKIAAVLGKSSVDISTSCLNMTGLTSCGADPPSEVACIVGLGPATAQAIADALYPEGAGSPSGAFIDAL
jgi:hypothetical protein